MLTPLTTREEDPGKTSMEYYYSQPHHHYYCPVPYNQSYALSSGYSYPLLHHHSNEMNVNSLVSNSVYTSTSHPPEDCSNELLYSQIPSDRQTTPVHDYTVSPISAVSVSPTFHLHSEYNQSSVEQGHYSNNLTAFVS